MFHIANDSPSLRKSHAWTRVAKACLSIVDGYPDKVKMRDRACALSLSAYQEADMYREIAALESRPLPLRILAEYFSAVVKPYAEKYREIAERFPNARQMHKLALQLADCQSRRVFFLRPTLHLYPEDATPDDAEAATIGYYDSLKNLPFHMRKRIAAPLFPGQRDALVLDLACLLAAHATLYGDLRAALSELKMTIQEALPLAILESLENGDDERGVEHFRGSCFSKIIKSASSPVVSKTVQGQEEGSANKRRRIRAELPESDLISPSNDADDDQSKALDHFSRRSKSLNHDDGFSKDVGSRLELEQFFANSGASPHYQNIFVERRGYAYSRHETAEMHNISPKTVDEIDRQTRARLLAAAKTITDDD